MRKVIDSVPFLALVLCVSAIMCGISYQKEEWVWMALWGISIPWDVHKLYEAVWVKGGKYKRLLSAQLGNSMICILSFCIAGYNVLHGEKWVAVCWLALAVVNVFVVRSQQRLYKRLLAMDARLEEWLATHFPDDNMNGITLERKR